MSTTTRVKFIESSKAVSSETLVESDEMEQSEVLELARKLAVEAQSLSKTMTMNKLR